MVFLVFVVYNANFRLVRIDDSVPARLLPFNLALHGTFYLEPWIEPYLPQARGMYGVYYAVKVGPHWLSDYPVILPVAISPLYLYPARWFSQLHIDPATGDLAATAIVDVMEKLSASLVAALSVGVLYLALRRAASRRSSLLLALVYALASSTWSISSQSLWRQGFTELSLALLMCALLRDPETRSYAFWIGGAVGLLASNAMQYLPFVVLLAAFLLVRQPKRFWLFCVPLVFIGGLTLAYNLHYFGSASGAYFMPKMGLNRPLAAVSDAWDRSPGYLVSRLPGPMRTPGIYHLWDGVIGQLISPSRGVLIFIPWVAFALWGCVRAWKQNRFGWERYLLLGMAIVFGLHARFGSWWAGWSFGPRYLTDFLPLLTFFVLPVWSEVLGRPALRVAFGAAVALALFVQIVGACYYRPLDSSNWDSYPVSVDVDHKRLWDWRDTTISRSWYTPRDEPTLYFEAWYLFRANGRREGSRNYQSAVKVRAN